MTTCSPVTKSPALVSRVLKFYAAMLLFNGFFTVPVAALGVPSYLDEELTQALDLDPDLDNGRELYEMCAECHGSQGWGSEDGAYPQIAGQHRNVVIKQIADFRVGNRENPAMLPFAEADILGGPQGVSDVAGYIASLPMSLEPGTGRGNNLALGERLYDENCSVCHDDNGEGFDAFFFPKVDRQHYGYLLRQLKWMKEGKRQNVYFGMLRRIEKMTVADLEAVSDYLSRLAPPDDEDDEDETAE